MDNMNIYTIFKHDRLTGKTINICGGSHDDKRQCRAHWQAYQAYMYGFYDQAVELLGSDTFHFMQGSRPLSFRLIFEGKDVEYFMILGGAGHELIQELSKLGMI